MGTSQQFTAPYTPQENPTKRVNRTVKTMIAQFAGQDQRNWDEKWPEKRRLDLDPDQEYIYFVGSETLPSACYILSDESSIPFYSTSNGYKY